jgi:hypothetical protein
MSLYVLVEVASTQMTSLMITTQASFMRTNLSDPDKNYTSPE